MNKQQEALRLALEALKKCDAALAEELAAWDIDPPLHHVLEASNACGPAITAIREALADHIVDANKMVEQPAQQWNAGVPPLYPEPEPGVSFKVADEQPAPPPECQTEAEKTAFAFGWWKALEMHRTPAQQQEPVAFMNPDDLCADTAFRWCKIDKFTNPVYTSPQSKPWVGLTDEERNTIYANAGTGREAMKVIEAKLREKNNG